MSAPEHRTNESSGVARAKRSMRGSHLLIALAIGALAVGAVLFQISDIGPADQPPITRRSISTDPPLPACIGLEGRELDRCQILKQVRPGEYEKGPAQEETDASFNSARAARGVGVEGGSSAETTLDPRN